MIKVDKYPWYLAPVHAGFVAVFLVLRIVMFFIGLPIVAINVLRVKDPRKPQPLAFAFWAWPWDSVISTTPEPWWWQTKQWQHHLGDRFSLWWWRAIRNPASNFSRFFGGNDDPDDWDAVRTTAASFQGYLKIAKTDWAYQIRWSERQWWLFYYRGIWKWSDTKYLDSYLGFKLGTEYEGLGFSVRFLPFRDR